MHRHFTLFVSFYKQVAKYVMSRLFTILRLELEVKQTNYYMQQQ